MYLELASSQVYIIMLNRESGSVYYRLCVQHFNRDKCIVLILTGKSQYIPKSQYIRDLYDTSYSTQLAQSVGCTKI